MTDPHADQFGSPYLNMPSRLNTGIDPSHQAPMPSPFNPYAMPSPNTVTSDVTISYAQPYIQSPAQMPNAPARSPYPQHVPMQRPHSGQSQPSRRTSGWTEDIDQTTNSQSPSSQSDMQDYLRLKQEEQDRKQQAQREWDEIQSQSQFQSSPHVSHQGQAGPMLRRPPGHVQRVYQSDFGCGYGYEDFDQPFGLPNRGRQTTVAAPNGHHYGPIAVTGTARIIRGNVVDSNRSNFTAKNHSYGGQMIVQGDATVWDGDQTIETANTFWQQGRIGQTDRLNETR